MLEGIEGIAGIEGGEGAVGVDKTQIDRGQVRDRLPVRDKGG